MRKPSTAWSVVAALAAALMLVAPTTSASAGYGTMGVIGKVTTTASTATTNVNGDERQMTGLCVTFVSAGNRRVKVTASARLVASGAVASGDLRIRRDTFHTTCGVGGFDYGGAAPAGGASAYMALAGGAGGESLLPMAEEVPPAGEWTYRLTVTKTAGSALATVVTGGTAGAEQWLLVEDIGAA